MSLENIKDLAEQILQVRVSMMTTRFLKAFGKTQPVSVRQEKKKLARLETLRTCALREEK